MQLTQLLIPPSVLSLPSLPLPWHPFYPPPPPDYAPISFSGVGGAALSLGYEFFYDQITHGDTSLAEPNLVFRRRRQHKRAEEEQVLQVVELRFRPMEVEESILVYSKTLSSAHVLQVSNYTFVWLRTWPCLWSMSSPLVRLWRLCWGMFVVWTVLQPALSTESQPALHVHRESQPTSVHAVPSPD